MNRSYGASIFLLGEVAHTAHHADALAGHVAENVAAILHRGVAAVLALEAIFRAPGFRAGVDGVMDAVDHAAAIIGMNAAGPGLDAGFNLAGDESEGGQETVVPPERVGRKIQVPDQI